MEQTKLYTIKLFINEYDKFLRTGKLRDFTFIELSVFDDLYREVFNKPTFYNSMEHRVEELYNMKKWYDEIK